MLSVAVSHDGQWVVSGSKDRGVQFWDAKTATAQCMLQGHKNSGTCSSSGSFGCSVTCSAVISIDLSPAGSVLATGSGDWQARICAHFFPFRGISPADVSSQGATPPYDGLVGLL